MPRSIPTDLTGDEMRTLIAAECDALGAMLADKNKRYGNSAFYPVRVFARGIDATAALRVRADDKISRIAAGSYTENDLSDLAGYLVLMLVALRLGRDDAGS
jgi:hypothetical protein